VGVVEGGSDPGRAEHTHRTITHTCMLVQIQSISFILKPSSLKYSHPTTVYDASTISRDHFDLVLFY